MFSLFLVQCKNSECLEGFDLGQTHPCFLKCPFAKSSRLDNDIQAETPCFEHFLALRLLHLWPLSELRAAAFLSSCKNSQLEHMYKLYASPPGDSFQCAAKTKNRQGASSANRVFLMCLMHLLFALPPFYLLPQSAKTELVQVLLVSQYKEPALIRVFLSLTLARPFLQWNAALPCGQIKSNQISLTESTAVVVLSFLTHDWYK